jgi:ribosomal protein S18 acetylase RimI-like enzyme
MEGAGFEIRPFATDHHDWATAFMSRNWGSTRIVSRGRIHNALKLAGFVALVEGDPVGLANYRLADGDCELVTLFSDRPGIGIGSALVEVVQETAQRAACGRLWLITTNDNMAALRFYQRRGFCLVALHRDALVASRQLKPEIPLIGAGGIPLRDELELEMLLGATPGS